MNSKEHIEVQEKKEAYRGGIKNTLWKAAAGLVIGMAAGALLAITNLVSPLLQHAGMLGDALPAAGSYAVAMTTLGIAGAGLGISRDILRKAISTIDGLFADAKSPQKSFAATSGPEIIKATEKSLQKEELSPFITVVYSGHPDDYPRSDTFHRDKLVASRIVLNMDISKTLPS